MVERPPAGRRVRTARPQWRRAVPLVVALRQAASPSPSPFALGCGAREATGLLLSAGLAPAESRVSVPRWGRMPTQMLEQAQVLGQA